MEAFFRKFGLEILGRRAGKVNDFTVTKPDDYISAFPVMSEPVALVAAGTATQIGAWANPTGRDILILEVFMDVTTKSTGVAECNVGVAANATTSSDTLMDGVDVGTAAIAATIGVNAGTNGRQSRKMSSTQYITFTGSAATTGLVGTYRVLYVQLPAAA